MVFLIASRYLIQLLADMWIENNFKAENYFCINFRQRKYWSKNFFFVNQHHNFFCILMNTMRGFSHVRETWKRLHNRMRARALSSVLLNMEFETCSWDSKKQKTRPLALFSCVWGQVNVLLIPLLFLGQNLYKKEKRSKIQQI